MDNLFPIYTTTSECQDCYKCVRHCGCKAIQIVNARAAVISDLCVCCGECVKTCPAHAKKIRSDLGRCKRLLESGAPVYASIAPSFQGFFRNTTIEQLAGALKQLGFAGVSETALGAQMVSAENVRYLETAGPGVYISSACPAAVEYIGKYLPEWKDRITPILSPVQAHARYLRSVFGSSNSPGNSLDSAPSIKVVFFGPCAAKKLESDQSPATLNLALTFADLQNWLEESKIDLRTVPDESVVPQPAEEGRLYSLEGGMNDTMRVPDSRTQLLAVSGLANIRRVLEQVTPASVERLGGQLFLEVLACDGGCINGPVMPAGGSAIDVLLQTAISAGEKDVDVTTVKPENTTDVERKPRTTSVGRPVSVDIQYRPVVKSVQPSVHTEREIKSVLEQIGKHRPEDELNCGGCGYNSCREFASALLDGKAETNMCLSWLRKITQKTSNALIRYIPVAVVLVDKNLQIIECNRLFAQMVGEETLQVFDVVGNLNGAFLDSMVEYTDLFNTVLASGEELERFNQLYGGRILNISVFSITGGQTAGAVIQDVTQSELHREQIAEKAREVIRKNVLTVQKIARDLGEHMADTEILLNEVAGTYSEHNHDTGQRLPGEKAPSNDRSNDRSDDRNNHNSNHVSDDSIGDRIGDSSDEGDKG